ncbi:immunoglobulin I-set domain protein [Cooperia oncophora]
MLLENVSLRKPCEEKCASDVTTSRPTDNQTYSELSKTAFFSNQSEDGYYEKALEEKASDRIAFSELTSKSHITKSSTPKSKAASMACAVEESENMTASKSEKLPEGKLPEDTRSGTTSQESTLDTRNKETGEVSGKSRGTSKPIESIGTMSEELLPVLQKRTVSENAKLARSTYSSIPQLSVIFSEEEGSATEGEESSSAMFCLSISNTVKVAETFVIMTPQPQQISPAQPRSGVSDEKETTSKSIKADEQQAKQVQESSLQKKEVAKKSKPSNVKYLSDETEKLLKKKAKMSEKYLKGSENDFGDQSTDQMADFGTDSDATMEQSDNEISRKVAVQERLQADFFSRHLDHKLIQDIRNTTHLNMNLKQPRSPLQSRMCAFPADRQQGLIASLQGKMCGYPIPEMIWLKNGVEINPALHPEKYSIDVQPGMAHEKVSFVQVVERANPNAPRLTQQLVAPHFDSILSDHDAVEGEKVVMMVTTQGAPPPDVRFYRDGKLISDSDKYEIRHEPEPIYKHWLILKNAKKTEEAEYACQAVNPAGEAWCYSDLIVRPLDKDSSSNEVEKAENIALVRSEEKNEAIEESTSRSPPSRQVAEVKHFPLDPKQLLRALNEKRSKRKTTAARKKQRNQKKEAAAVKETAPEKSVQSSEAS